ncbi:MAG: thioredoxin [Armatimonadota bacterium]
MSGLVQQVTNANFDHDVLQAEVPVLVDFWAPWCGPCRMMGPELDKTATQLGDTARVVKLNIDEHPSLATRFGVMSIPTLVVFHHGREIGRHVGFISGDALVSSVEQYLGVRA